MFLAKKQQPVAHRSVVVPSHAAKEQRIAAISRYEEEEQDLTALNYTCRYLVTTWYVRGFIVFSTSYPRNLPSKPGTLSQGRDLREPGLPRQLLQPTHCAQSSVLPDAQIG